MSNGVQSADPRWPRLLSLAVHEFRTPVTVVAGYIRMLLKDRAGQLTEQQRRLLEEAEKSCARLSALIAEMSELAGLEGGSSAFNRGRVEIAAVARDAIASLPPLPDRDIAVTLDDRAGGAMVAADSARLKTALAAVVAALRRELVTSAELSVRIRVESGDGAGIRIAIAGPEHLDAVDRLELSALTTFDEWRGGCGLSLAIARRVIGAHGGRIGAPGEEMKTGALIVLPQ